MSDWNDTIIEEFRANDGHVARFGNGHLVLLTTTGAKTGLKRVTPLLAVERPNPFGTIYVIAAYAGAPQNPAWYHNILETPEVFVELATDNGIVTYDATAAVLPRAERDAIYAEVAATNPGFAEYETKTDRVIPVVELRRFD